MFSNDTTYTDKAHVAIKLLFPPSHTWCLAEEEANQEAEESYDDVLTHWHRAISHRGAFTSSLE